MVKQPPPERQSGVRVPLAPFFSDILNVKEKTTKEINRKLTYLLTTIFINNRITKEELQKDL